MIDINALFGLIGAALIFIILLIVGLCCAFNYIRDKNNKLQRVIILKQGRKKDGLESDCTSKSAFGLSSTPYQDEPEALSAIHSP